jgi:chemotaxis response regulator CheB
MIQLFVGDDSVAGLLEMRNAGAFTVAQEEEICVSSASRKRPSTEVPSA